ncbi:hypothetical protein EJ07DRAFT_183641 [Lizonia empirigonia]|nr:hypothetical protein EJ07DRAFT_183641 [Lizonia empirigonia]
MSMQRGAAAPFLNNRKESQLRRLRRGLQDQGLLNVLDSFPAPDSFTFIQTQKSGNFALKLFLGDRPKSDNSTCKAWACIESERKDLQPPVTFYDQELSKDRTRILEYPRSASSLMRRAAELQPPYCFLQHDPHVNVAKDVRNMICASILYQALVAGVDTSAFRWSRFEDSLGRALRYINTREAYHQWLHDQKIATLMSTTGFATPPNYTGQKKEEIRSHDLPAEKLRGAGNTREKDYTGGIVYPSGSRVALRPGTSLSRLKKQIGDARFQLLDHLPAIAMSISPHTLGEPYFPFRLQIGTHDPESSASLALYAYLVHDGLKKAAVKIFSYDNDGQQRAWALEGLGNVDLLQPFDYLNKLKEKSNGTRPGNSARAAKIRSVISYYFFLAENEGLIGDPRIAIGEAFGKRLCTVCAELQEARLGGDNASRDDGNVAEDNETNVDIPVHEPAELVDEIKGTEQGLIREEESEGEPSLVVALKTQPRHLMYIITSGPSEYRGEYQYPDNDTQPDPHQIVDDEVSLEEAPDREPPKLQLGSHSSSQLSRGPSEASTATTPKDMDASEVPTTVADLETPLLNVDLTERAYKPRAATDRNVTHIDDTPVATPPLGEAIIAGGERLDSLCPTNSEKLPSIAITAVLNATIHDIRESSPQLPTARPSPNKESNDSRNRSDGDFVPVNTILSSALPAQYLPPTIQATKPLAEPWSDDSLHKSMDTGVSGRHDVSNRPDTLESTPERNLKTQWASPVIPQLRFPTGILNVIHLSEDEMADDTVHEIEPAPEDGIKVSHQSNLPELPLGSSGANENIFMASNKEGKVGTANTLEADAQMRVTIDLTQASPSARGEKRKSVSITDDSNDNVIEEVDYDAWRRAARGQRRR